MKALQMKSMAYILRVLFKIVWVVQIVFYSVVFFGMIAKFSFSNEFTIDGWPVTLPAGSYTTQVSPTSPKLSDVKVQVEKASLSFRTQRDWRIIAIAITGVCFGFGIALAITYQLRKIFATLTQANPFVASNAGRIRIIAFILISFPLVSTLLGTITNQYVKTHFAAGGNAFSFYYNLDFSAVLTGLVVLVIAEVFRLGTQLKEEQDLTI